MNGQRVEYVTIDEAATIAADAVKHPLDFPTYRDQGEETTEERTDDERQGEDVDGDAKERSGGPFGGLSAAEAGRRSAEARREAGERRRREISEARLTARQRLGLALSKKLSVADYEQVIGALLTSAKKGDEKAAHALARLHDQAYGRAQVDPGDKGQDVDELTWEEMSPAQRSAMRARLIHDIEADEQPASDATDPRGDDAEHADAEHDPPHPREG